MPPVGGEQGRIFNRMARGGLTGKVMFEKKLEGVERVSRAMTGIRVTQADGSRTKAEGGNVWSAWGRGACPSSQDGGVIGSGFTLLP